MESPSSVECALGDDGDEKGSTASGGSCRLWCAPTANNQATVKPDITGLASMEGTIQDYCNIDKKRMTL